MTRYMPPDPVRGSIWKHKIDQHKRAQVTQVTSTEVEVKIVYSSAADAFKLAAQTNRLSRATWHRYWTFEQPAAQPGVAS